MDLRLVVILSAHLLQVIANSTTYKVSDEKPETDEQRLLNYLMTHYQKAVRPVLNATTSVKVHVGLTLNQIFDVDEKNQVLTTHVWLDQEWKDEKLTWIPEQYNGLKTLRVPCGLLWLPDIVLYNSVDENRGYMQALAMVSHDGTVFWPPIVKYRSTCIIDIKYFPFDDQICKLKLGSWAYDGTQVDMHKRNEGVDLSNYISNGEWEMVKFEARRNVVYYPCCPEPYPDVTFYLHLRRRVLYYTYNIIIPCVMLSALTLLGFWMRPDSGEKVTLGLTVLLAFSVFMLLIAESMPATSFFVPLIGIYITTVMSLTSISVICSVIVSNIHNEGTKDRPVPRWLQRVTQAVACLAFVRRPLFEEEETKPERQPSYRSCNGDMDSERNLIVYENGEPVKSSHSRSYSQRKGNSDMHPDCEVILHKLRTIMEKQEDSLKKQSWGQHWHDVAEVTDRCLFWLYFLATISASIVVLAVIPYTKDNLTIESYLQQSAADNNDNPL